MSTDDGSALTAALISFLKSGADETSIAKVGKVTRDQAKELIAELVPVEIQMRGSCEIGIPAVVAAPHVSFDHWSEYFCNRIAREFHIGWVVALNYRDQDKLRIPVHIGRHVHVNRPTESDGPGRKERVTERAAQVFDEYLDVIRQASGAAKLPMALLIEIHSHRQTSDLELATSGVDHEFAAAIRNSCETLLAAQTPATELRIEPIDTLRMKAGMSKQMGSMRPEITQFGFHIEIPRSMRRDAVSRESALPILYGLIKEIISGVESRLRFQHASTARH